jgi:hypothetical protein
MMTECTEADDASTTIHPFLAANLPIELIELLYQAAKLLFTSISNWAHLATTLIYLGENQAAIESARKAGNTQ